MKNAAQWDTEAIERLKELGLTEYDAKIYCTLVAKSPQTAIDLSREADVPMSKIYVALSRLENGGWISVVPERPKQYRAVDPAVTVDNACSQAVRRLEETRSQLRKSLKETFDRKTETEASEFMVVHGTVNALNHLREIVQTEKGGMIAIAAFAGARTVERIGELIEGYEGPKRLFVFNVREGMSQYAETLRRVPFATALEAEQRWHGGVVFIYTEGSGMYATVEEEELKMALIIRDRGLLELMKTFMGGAAHHPAVRLEPEGQESHASQLAKAHETFGKLLKKHK